MMTQKGVVKILVLKVILFSSISCLAQNYFEGAITYKEEYISKNSRANIDSLEQNKPFDSTLYYIKKGYYKNVYYKNGAFSSSYSFDYHSFRMYDLYPGNNIGSWRDARKQEDNVWGKIVERKDTLIDGYRCDKLICTSKKYNYVIYFSKDIQYDTSFFTSQKVGDWGSITVLTNGGIHILTIVDKGDYYVYGKASNIQRKSLNAELFELPSNILMGASASELDKENALKGDINDLYKCIYSTLKYPQKAYSEGKEYTVYIKILINEKGKIELAEAYEKDEYGFYKESLEAFNLCDLSFEPGLFHGKKVKVVTYLPIWFKKEN
jgi:hypothetical protein